MTREPPVRRCDACGHCGPSAEVLPDLAYGTAVALCADPVMCRRRAEVLGIWKRYP